jgi:hypothetical protein
MIQSKKLSTTMYVTLNFQTFWGTFLFSLFQKHFITIHDLSPIHVYSKNEHIMPKLDYIL